MANADSITYTQRSAARLPDLRLRRALWQALWLGTTVVLLFPAARGQSEWLGWLPLWLVGMPACALWALHGFGVPRLPLSVPAARQRRRRSEGQVRRRSQRGGARRTRRVA